MRDEYRLRKAVQDAVFTLRQLMSAAQRAGAYDWYNIARDQAEELEFILRKLEIDRQRELKDARQLRLADDPDSAA